MIKLNGSNRRLEFTAFSCEQSEVDRVVLATGGDHMQKGVVSRDFVKLEFLW